jgi:hypothetical protein
MKTKKGGIPNARFWNYTPVTGWVKFTLKHGQNMSIAYGGRTDEGYDRAIESFAYLGCYLYLDIHRDGVDCDGRTSSLTNLSAKVDQLKEFWNTDENCGTPEWRIISDRARDYAAEKAGY